MTAKDLSGKTILITGASDGIGAAAAKILHQQGARVVVIGRSPDKTKRVAEAIQSDYFICDFAKLAQVKDLAQQLLAKYPQIDILVNNAGLIWDSKRTLTEDGFEMMFQVNHLSPFLLTYLLKERLWESHSQIINTSSIGNNMGRLKLDDLNSEQSYRNFIVYGTTKLENILFTNEIHRQWSDKGITTASFHPGPVATQFGNQADFLTKLIYHTPLKDIMLKTGMLIHSEQGADTLIWLINSECGKDWQSGGYYSKRKPGRMSPQASQAELAKGLWEASLNLLKPFLA